MEMRRYAARETGLVDLFIVENRPSNHVHIHPSIRLTIIIIYISNPFPPPYPTAAESRVRGTHP